MGQSQLRYLLTTLAALLLSACAGPTMRSGVELWNVFLVVALLALVAEMVVSRHWRPESA